MNDICRTPAQVCERLSNEYGDLTVVLFGDALEGSVVKARVTTNTKYICFRDAMETGKSVANILSDEFINVRAEEYRKDNETIKSSLEHYGKECIAPMEYLKSRKNSKVVFLTFDNYVCSIWQLTVMAFLESQGICNSIVRIVVDDNDWTVGGIDHIELAGAQQAYESILCNHNFISLDQYKISEEAVKGWLDIQNPNGVLVNFINNVSYKDFQELDREQQKILFNTLIEKITIDEMYIPGEKEVCLHITIFMKIPGYDPKHSLYFKRDLKNLDKEKTNSYSKNKSSLLDGGEVKTLLNTPFFNHSNPYKIHDLV